MAWCRYRIQKIWITPPARSTGDVRVLESRWDLDLLQPVLGGNGRIFLLSAFMRLAAVSHSGLVRTYIQRLILLKDRARSFDHPRVSCQLLEG